MMFYVYALFNKENRKIYIGETEDLERRLTFHKERTFKNSYTSRFSGEWIIIYKETCKDCQEAIKREKQLKSFRGREFIKKHIPW